MPTTHDFRDYGVRFRRVVGRVVGVHGKDVVIQRRKSKRSR